jgi:hypothetical protein
MPRKRGEAYLEDTHSGICFFGIILPDSRQMGCTGTIAGVVMPTSMTTPFSFGYSRIPPPFFPSLIWNSASPAGKEA